MNTLTNRERFLAGDKFTIVEDRPSIYQLKKLEPISVILKNGKPIAAFVSFDDEGFQYFIQDVGVGQIKTLFYINLIF